MAPKKTKTNSSSGKRKKTGSTSQESLNKRNRLAFGEKFTGKSRDDPPFATPKQLRNEVPIEKAGMGGINYLTSERRSQSLGGELLNTLMGKPLMTKDFGIYRGPTIERMVTVHTRNADIHNDQINITLNVAENRLGLIPPMALRVYYDVTIPNPAYQNDQTLPPRLPLCSGENGVPPALVQKNEKRIMPFLGSHCATIFCI